MNAPGKPPRNWRTRHIDGPLGARIVELRTLAGLTRTQMAARLGVSVAQLQHAEDGENRFSAPQIWQICSILGVEAAEVFSGLPIHVAKNQDVAAATDRVGSGVEENGSTWVGPDFVRRDLLALAKAARRLTPDQVEEAMKILKSMKPKA
ncbi:helix-turn-helix domain-containing protein [Brevundimonas staleyi]|uniref:Helix-turn-helix domain-containing protein n=1 Tax=Brevundimonas staleyi TaxID=74326 RepID=A0ABW0FVV0_9CAUL